MAGYVKLFRAIWQDRDFTRLDESAQRLYMLLISQPDITHVGILPLMPGRWARLSASSNPDTVRRDLDALSTGGFVVIDPETEELLVRSYLVYDEAFKLTNGTKSLVRAYEQVLSEPLRNRIRTLLASVGVTLDVTVEVSQQPAANTSTTNQQPAACEFPGVTDAVMADALLLLLEWKCSTARNPGGLRRKLRDELPSEHGGALDAYLTRHPDATAEELAAHVLKVPGLSVVQSTTPPDWYADPTCTTCDGDGWDNTAPEGAPAINVPCDCRRTEPYMATIHELRPA